MIRDRRRSIPSPYQSISNHVPGALCCFRSICCAFPKGAFLSAPFSMSRTLLSIWRPSPLLRPAPFAVTTHPACPAGTPAGSTTCPVSAGASGFRSLPAASSVHGPTAIAASSSSAYQGSPHLGQGPPTGSGRPKRTSARRWAVRPALDSPHAWRSPPAPIRCSAESSDAKTVQRNPLGQWGSMTGRGARGSDTARSSWTWHEAPLLTYCLTVTRTPSRRGQGPSWDRGRQPRSLGNLRPGGDGGSLPGRAGRRPLAPAEESTRSRRARARATLSSRRRGHQGDRNAHGAAPRRGDPRNRRDAIARRAVFPTTTERTVLGIAAAAGRAVEASEANRPVRASP